MNRSAVLAQEASRNSILRSDELAKLAVRYQVKEGAVRNDSLHENSSTRSGGIPISPSNQLLSNMA
jgi:hypothetical protein